MQQQIKEAPIDAEAAHVQPAQAIDAAPRARAAAARWRALAGMAISLMLACLVITLEYTNQAIHRALRMSRHANALLSRVSRLESEIAGERAQIAAAHRELAATRTLRTLLRAPDADLLRLSPPPPVGHRIAAAHRAEAMLALSSRERSAVIMVVGLKPPADDTLFVLWWSIPHAAPIRAAEFRTPADGSALVMASMPPGIEVSAAMITAERAVKDSAGNTNSRTAPTAPSGSVELRGTIAPARAQ